MIEVKGTCNTAVCYTSQLEKSAENQIRAFCDQEAFSDCKIRIMPDVHAGMGCTIGTTMTITDKIVPGMVGVDIGCGMETVKVSQTEMDFRKLDALIREQIPCGREIRRNPHALNSQIDLSQLRCAKYVNLERAALSIGTLGGGNHFIEVDRSEHGDLYIDTDNMILRKGSVSARSGEKLLIPINMRDGSLICIGKGNPDWNYSAPHGAGRLMSRKEAFAKLSLWEYREEMSGIYTTCVSRDTLDESPMAYKGIGEIISQIGPTVDIVEQIRPVYNFKASE